MSDAAPAQANIKPIAVAILIAGAAVLTLGFGIGDRSAQPQRTSAAPPFTVAAALDAQAHAPIDLEFETTADLALDESGWKAGSLHLHALLNGVELMPAADAITQVAPGRYVWRIPADLPAGEHSLQLMWARTNHSRVPGGASAEVAVRTAAATAP